MTLAKVKLIYASDAHMIGYIGLVHSIPYIILSIVEAYATLFISRPLYSGT